MQLESGQAMLLVVGLGVAAQWVAWRTRLPAIVLLAGAGLLAGPVLGWLRPAQQFGPMLGPLIGFAVAIILFEGGLKLHLSELRQAAHGVRRLVSAGLLLSFALGAAAAHWVGGLSLPVALVLGAILVVTGPTVVMPLLRQARLARRPASLLKWEGIVNDPLGALLAVLVFGYFVHGGEGSALGGFARGLAASVLAALVLGLGGGMLIVRAYRRGQVPEFLKAPLLLGCVLLVYAGANRVHEEAGLLATTVLGLVIGNSGLASIAELTRFKESVTILLVSCVFVVLSAGLDPALLAGLDLRAALLLAAFVLVVRPAAMFLATLGTDVTLPERVLLACVAPRGVVAAAVAGVFGPHLVAAGHADAALLAPLVFAMIFLTVVLHGLSMGWLARRLGLAAGPREGVLIVGATPWSTALAGVLAELRVPVLVADEAYSRLRAARLAGVPVHYGQVLSEVGEESLPLHEMGWVLAVSDNDAYNALVCVHFAPELGHHHAFQLGLRALDADDPRALRRTLRGDVLMRDDADFDSLQRRCFAGWTFRKTPLTEDYTFEQLQAEEPEGAEIVLLLDANGRPRFHSPTAPLQPEAGQTVVTFAAPRPEQPSS